jgi:hypothetical protein
VFDGNKAQLFKDSDTQQDAFRKDEDSKLLNNPKAGVTWCQIR